MIQRAVRAISFLLAVLGAGCLAAAGLVPYERVRQWLDRFAADGSADAYTQAIHQAIGGRLRYAGLGLIVVGAVLYRARERVATVVRRLWVSAAGLLDDAVDGLRRAWSEASVGERTALGGILGVGLGVRLWLLGWPMRYDEAYTFLNYARSPLILGLTRYDTPNNHLFHTFLVHVAYRLFGDAPWALRLPAFLAGVLVMPLSYLAVRRLYGRGAALLATALVATSMAMIETSTNARGYSIVTLMFLALVCLGAYLRRADNEAGWALFALLAVVALYTIPTGLYALAAVVGWLVLEAWAGNPAPPPRRVLLRLTSAVAATALLAAALYAPILIRTDVSTLLASPIVSIKVQPVSWSEFLAGNAAKVVDAWWRWASDWPWWFRGVWLAGMAAALALHRRVGRGRVPLAAGLLLGCVPLVVAQRVVPPSRVWIFLLPIFAGMGAAGVLQLAAWAAPARWVGGGGHGRRLAIGLALLLVAGGALSVPDRSRRYSYNLPDFPDAEETVRFLAPRLRPGDKVLVLGLSQTPFLYYAGRHGLPYLDYVYDYVLEGWAPLRAAPRVFVVVNERKHTVEHVLAEAQLAGAPPPVPIAAFEASHVYLVARE